MMANEKRPRVRINDRVVLASHKGLIPAYADKPFVGRETVLRVSSISGKGSKRDPWHVNVTDDAGHFWVLMPDDVVPADDHATRKQSCKACKGAGCARCRVNYTTRKKKTPAAQLDREIASALSGRAHARKRKTEESPEIKALRDQKAGYLRALEYAGITREKTHEYLREIDAIDAKIKALSSKTAPSHAKKKQPLRVAYRLQLSPSELRAVEFARGRYAWPDMLAAHASEGGLVAFTEPEMWQWTDDVDSDTAGGHSPFPLASGAFAEKLQRFYDERV